MKGLLGNDDDSLCSLGSYYIEFCMEIDKRIEVKQWNAVALWSWNVAVENCAICKNSINETCLECQAN